MQPQRSVQLQDLAAEFGLRGNFDTILKSAGR